MDDSTYACTYLGHQMERMFGQLADVASNPTSKETLLPQCLPVIEDGWTHTRLPGIPAPNVEVRFLIGCGAIPLPHHGCSGTTRWRRLLIVTVYNSSPRQGLTCDPSFGLGVHKPDSVKLVHPGMRALSIRPNTLI
jgi:hypothetical protein